MELFMSPSSVSPAASNFPLDPVELPSRNVVESSTPEPAVAADLVDRSFHATLARFTGGLSPAAVALAFADWQLHLLASPGKRAALAGGALQNASAFAEALMPHAVFQPWSLIKPAATDRRFSDADWELPNFNLLAQAFLLTEQWWHSTTSDIRGLAHSSAAISDFAIRQGLDTVAPTNFAWSNPEVLRKIMDRRG
jgi:polyhydroxyalkanoate synthase